MSAREEPESLERLLAHACCPVCLHEERKESALRAGQGAWICSSCAASYAVVEGIPDLRAPVDVLAPESPRDEEARRFYEKVYAEGSYGRDVQDEHLPTLGALLSQIPEDRLVAELGTGRGALQGLHPGYVGTDLSVRALRRYLRTPAFASDIQRLPLRSSSVGFLYSVATLEHVPRPDLALAEIARVLAPGGSAYLAPAWNCRTWAAEGLNVRPYRELTPSQKLRKASIPLRNSLAWRGAFTIPRRVARRAAWWVSGRPTRFRYRQLAANFEVFWASDSDATAQLDPHEAGLYFQSRGWRILSPRGPWAALFHRAQPLLVQRP